MRVQFSVVGHRPTDDLIANLAVDLDAVPREGEDVTLPGIPAQFSTVRTVVWYPLGDPDGTETGPFVYVVVGQRRPSATHRPLIGGPL